MTAVGQSERATQDRVIALSRGELRYGYLGDWTDRDGNSNIEQALLSAWLSKRGCTPAQIAALEARLAKARAVKQGMMQELLTGRIRLV